ncbi:McrB family protein [Advenella incenata]
MFLSKALATKAFQGLKRLDQSAGKSRQEKVSGLRHLLATSELLLESKTSSLDLAVGSTYRSKFIEAVGNVVAINDAGLYTKDFNQAFEVKGDYGVGSNFFTTRLANSRSSVVKYPGRPAPLMDLIKEQASIVDGADLILLDDFGVKNIRVELCIWLLRDTHFADATIPSSNSELFSQIRSLLKLRYLESTVDVIYPTFEEFTKFLADGQFILESNVFSAHQSDLTDLADTGEIVIDSETSPKAGVLNNDLSDTDPIYQIVLELLSRGSKGIIFSGPPGTSKTWYALKIALKIIDGEMERLERVQFHPAFSYEDFIEGLVSVGSPTGGGPLFRVQDKIFLRLCERARLDKDNNYLLLIDELSRGDPSKIFGELLTYIEADYREIAFSLPYSEKKITIPQNVVIFATMNPYDKSVVDLDSAMERRFDIIELNPDVSILKNFLTGNGIEGYKVGNIVGFFNKVNHYAPHGFGHTYFKDVKVDQDLILLWNHKLKNILEKMFRFEEDVFQEVKNEYKKIIDEPRQVEIL